MLPVLVDTDVLSEIIKARRSNLVRRAELYLIEHPKLTLSAATMYEIERGLLAKRATRLLAQFDVVLQRSNILEITIPILHRAASLWALAKHQAKAHDDADLIIAATALENDLVLVTGNIRHFDWIEGLQLDSWD